MNELCEGDLNNLNGQKHLHKPTENTYHFTCVSIEIISEHRIYHGETLTFSDEGGIYAGLIGFGDPFYINCPMKWDLCKWCKWIVFKNNVIFTSHLSLSGHPGVIRVQVVK